MVKNTMTQVNTKRLIENIKNSNIYTPIFEAIVNSIDAINCTKNKGQITITFFRDDQLTFNMDGEKMSPPINKIVIEDNGVGFNNDNRESFNTLYSDYKYNIGGKGFGRFTFLKFFSDVTFESVYKFGKNYEYRNFEFIDSQNIINNEKIGKTENKLTGTVLTLNNIKKEYKYTFNKKLDTIARKILEQLLVYFVIDGYACPEIIVKENGVKKPIVLNDYLEKKNEIVEMDNEIFTLDNKELDRKEIFKIKIFKIFYSTTRSAVNLVANKRQVTSEYLYQYIPEFKDDFYDLVDGQKKTKIKKNYSIKSYVMGEYLDNNVSVERNKFDFPEDANLFCSLSQTDIEKKSAEITKKIFGEEVMTRQKGKEKRIRDYVDLSAPWYKSYVDSLDFSALQFNIPEEEIETELQKVRLKKEKQAKVKINKLLSSEKIEKDDKIKELIGEITEASKSDLIHYVATRKIVLDMFKRSLEIKENDKYELEEVVHNIIFPLKKDSADTNYNDHNLWMIDERLSFNEFLSSDKPLGNGSKDRPDLLIFDKALSVREGDNPGNPITIIEFKRPQRKEYNSNEDPIAQIGKYVEQIRAGKHSTPQGRIIKANGTTPAYGFLICDLTNKIKNICEKTHDLTKSADGESYFGYKNNYNFYIEVVSFDKLLKDAELRNKIFFNKLNIV